MRSQLPDLICHPAYRLRYAVDEREDVSSDLLIDGADKTVPLVTIGITTYKRADFLVDAVRSALAQNLGRPFEILVVDDDPASTSAGALITALPELLQRNFRYYRHRENLGIYHNFNRILRYARGEWLTILNDDDMLDSNYLSLMFEELERDPRIDGLIAQKRTLDQRLDADQMEGGQEGRQFVSRDINLRFACKLLREKGVRHFLGAATQRLRTELAFRKGVSRHIPVHKLFWGSILGTGCGFIFRTRNALAIGGFYQDETPSSDYWFYTRYAKFFHLRQHRAVAATMRKAANETARRENVMLSFRNAYGIQQAIAGSDAPRWWLKLSPMVLAWHQADFRTQWRAALSEQEIEQATGVRIGRERPRTLALIRFLLRGY